MIRMINTHAEGEIGYVAVEGVPEIAGDTLAEKLATLNKGDDALRRMLTLAPRGNPASSVNLLFPPQHPDADIGFIVLQPDQAHASSGSNSICVVTALLEAKMLPAKDGEVPITLETAAGLIAVQADWASGKCRSVTLDMVPSFVEMLDCPIFSPEWGQLSVDICYGGIFYALVDAGQIGLSIIPENAARLAAAGMALKDIINAHHKVVHPQIPEISGIAYVMFTQAIGPNEVRTATIMAPGRIDRSPCGTGSSAHLASMAARGQIAVGEKIITRSIIGSRFEVTLMGINEVAGRTAIMPRIKGRGWRFGETSIMVDASDPFADGFAVTDVWGPDANSLNR